MCIRDSRSCFLLPCDVSPPCLTDEEHQVVDGVVSVIQTIAAQRYWIAGLNTAEPPLLHQPVHLDSTAHKVVQCAVLLPNFTVILAALLEDFQCFPQDQELSLELRRVLHAQAFQRLGYALILVHSYAST